MNINSSGLKQQKTKGSVAARAFFETGVDAYSGLFADCRSGAASAFQRRLKEVASLSAAFSGKLLDCAVGSGEVTSAALRSGSFQSATLVDFSPAMLKKARTLLGNFTEIDFDWIESDCFAFLERMRPESVDCLLCIGLIAHTGRLEEMMGLLRRCVNPMGGVLFQSTLANHKGVALHRWLTGERYFRRYGYRISYQTYKQVATAATAAGFAIRDVRRFSMFIPFLDRMCPRMNFWIEEALDRVARRVGSEAVFLLRPA